MDYLDAAEILDEVRASEIECTHCGRMADGTITIETDAIHRNHRICNACANEILEQL